jgi:hypothetical protein
MESIENSAPLVLSAGLISAPSVQLAPSGHSMSASGVASAYCTLHTSIGLLSENGESNHTFAVYPLTDLLGVISLFVTEHKFGMA